MTGRNRRIMRHGLCAKPRRRSTASRRARDDPVQFAVERPLGLHDFIPVLRAQEEAFRHPEITREPQIEFGINRAHSIDHLGDPLRCHPDIPGKLLDTEAFGFEKFADQQLPRSSKRVAVSISVNRRIALCWISGGSLRLRSRFQMRSVSGSAKLRITSYSVVA